MKAAGVKNANVFYYFPNKEALGLELLDRMATFAVDHILTPTFDDIRHPTEQLRDYLKLVRGHMEESYCAGGCPLGNLPLEVLAYEGRLHREIET